MKSGAVLGEQVWSPGFSRFSQTFLSTTTLFARSDDDTAQIKLKLRIKRKTKPEKDIHLFIYSKFYLP